jgi:hypothetical protein
VLCASEEVPIQPAVLLRALPLVVQLLREDELSPSTLQNALSALAGVLASVRGAAEAFVLDSGAPLLARIVQRTTGSALVNALDACRVLEGCGSLSTDALLAAGLHEAVLSSSLAVEPEASVDVLCELVSSSPSSHAHLVQAGLLPRLPELLASASTEEVRTRALLCLSMLFAQPGVVQALVALNGSLPSRNVRAMLRSRATSARLLQTSCPRF